VGIFNIELCNIKIIIKDYFGSSAYVYSNVYKVEKVDEIIIDDIFLSHV